MPDLPTVPDSIGLTLAHDHIRSEFSSFVIVACNDLETPVIIDACVGDIDTLFHLKNQLASLCHDLRQPNFAEEEA